MHYLTDTTPEQRKATVAFIRWHRAFIRSTADLARKPGSSWRETMTRPDAQTALWEMVEKAINGKAEIQWPKKADWEYAIASYRDQQRIHDRLQRRIRVYQFETKECRRRFSHLLSSRHED